MAHAPRSDEDFSDEIEAHLALETDRLVADGMSPDEARAAARRRSEAHGARRCSSTSRGDDVVRPCRREIRGAPRTLLRHRGVTCSRS